MAPLLGAVPNTTLPAPKPATTQRYCTQAASLGTWGFGEGAPRTGSPWGEPESFMVQVPLTTPVMNHLQLRNARWGTDCSQEAI